MKTTLKYSKGMPVMVLDRYHSGIVLKSKGVITEVTEHYIETEHRRSPIDYPNLGDMGYVKINVRHYGEQNIESIN